MYLPPSQPSPKGEGAVFTFPPWGKMKGGNKKLKREALQRKKKYGLISVQPSVSSGTITEFNRKRYFMGAISDTLYFLKGKIKSIAEE
jgi:hypothetical protein